MSLDPGAFPAERPTVAAGARLHLARLLSVHGGVALGDDNPRVVVGSALQTGAVSIIFNCTLDLAIGFDPFDAFSVASVIDLSPVVRGGGAR